MARRAALFVQEIEIHQTILEGDSKIVINYLKRGDSLRSAHGHMIKNTISHVNSLISYFFFFSYVFRQGNALAHTLARRAKLSSPLSIWMEVAVLPNLFSLIMVALPAY